MSAVRRGPGSLKRIANLAAPRWRALLIGTLFLALSSTMSLLYPQIIRRIVDEALGARQGSAIDSAALLVLLIFWVEGVATGLRSYIFTATGERIVADLRQRLYDHLLAQDMTFFDTVRTGELTSRLVADTGVLQNAVSVNISMLLRSFASSLGGIALLLYTSPRLTAIMLAVVPVVVVGATVFGRHVRHLARATQDALAAAGEVAEEVFSGMRTVRSFAREPAEIQRYHTVNEQAFTLALRRSRWMAAFAGGATFAGYGSLAVVLWYGGHLVIDGAMTVGELTAFLLYTLIVAFSLGTLGALWGDFMRAMGATERVFEMLDQKPKILNQQGLCLPQARGAVAFEAVDFTYPGRPDVSVLHQLNFDLQPGEVVALVGPSGAGKSTIAALIARFYDVSGGKVLFDGHDVRELQPYWLRQQIGTVAQEPALFSRSIADNIRYARPDATDAQVEAAATAANAHAFIVAFPQRYHTLVGERGVQLSGGQKQRVAIARAVLKNPALLILDEATSALDAESEYLVKEALDRLMKTCTTLVIAHRLSTVKDAHRVLVMDHGRLVQMGPHAELMMASDGLYRRLVERQFVTGGLSL